MKKARTVKTKNYSAQWQLHRKLTEKVMAFDRPLEQRELERHRPKGAPLEMIDLLF